MIDYKLFFCTHGTTFLVAYIEARSEEGVVGSGRVIIIAINTKRAQLDCRFIFWQIVFESGCVRERR